MGKPWKMRIHFMIYEKLSKIDKTNAYDWTKYSNFTLPDSQIIINYNVREFLNYLNS